MNAVIVDGDVSYPATSGKRLRTLNLLLRMARRHQVAYIARHHGRPEEAQQAREFFQDHGVHTILVDHPLPRKSGIGFYPRLAANLFSSVPYSVAIHTSEPMKRAVNDYAATHQVEVWQFEWSGYLSTLADPAARKILMAHNVDSLIWQRYHETERNPLKRWYIRGQWRKFERFERWAFHAADRVVACTEEDAALVRDWLGQPNVAVVENGIDRKYFETVQEERDPNQVLFLGALDWRPNLDALDVLLDQTFPEVHARHPQARLCIVGRHPPAGLPQRIAAVPGAALFADVADVRPYLASSGLMAVPLRIGGGSRLKILEALAAGLPVVSTRIGAEGLLLEPERDLILVENPAEMTAALLRCLRAPGPAQAMAEHGRQVVLERYDWDVLAEKLEAVWERCCQKAAWK